MPDRHDDHDCGGVDHHNDQAIDDHDCGGVKHDCGGRKWVNDNGRRRDDDHRGRQRLGYYDHDISSAAHQHSAAHRYTAADGSTDTAGSAARRGVGTRRGTA